MPTVKYYTVTFVNVDGSEIRTQTVEEGHAAEAPDLPDDFIEEGIYFTFREWGVDLSKITANIIIIPNLI